MSAGTWSSTRLKGLPLLLALTLSACLQGAAVRRAGPGSPLPGRAVVFGRVALFENGAPAKFTLWREGSLDLYRVENGGVGPTLPLDKDGWFFWDAAPGTLVLARLEHGYGVRPGAYFTVPEPGAPVYLGTLKVEVAATRKLNAYYADKVTAEVLDERELAEKELTRRFPNAPPARVALMKQDPELPRHDAEGGRRRVMQYLGLTPP